MAPRRITTDLAEDLYAYLRRFAQDREVAAADVVRVLIRQMMTDPVWSACVTAELERRRDALAEAMRVAKE